jgi:hypothetical protein
MEKENKMPNLSESNQAGAVCAILVGRAENAEKACSLADSSRGCPYVAMYEAKGSMVVGVFVIPPIKQEWIEYPAQHPELLDLEEAEVVITHNITAHSPWSRGEVRPEAEIAPCGTNCSTCPQYTNGCQGCPATIYYLAAE